VEHGKEDDPQGPDVGLQGVVSRRSGDFWRAIFRGSNPILASFGSRDSAETEVDDLGLELVVDHDVVQLQIPVGNVLGMETLDGLDDLTEDATGSLLGDGTTKRLDEAKEVPSADVLHEEVDVVAIFPAAMGTRNVGVMQDLASSDLVVDVLTVEVLAGFGDGLEGVQLVVRLDEIDGSNSSCAEILDSDVFDGFRHFRWWLNIEKCSRNTEMFVLGIQKEDPMFPMSPKGDF